MYLDQKHKLAWIYLVVSSSLWRYDDGNDDSVETQRTSENFDDEHLHESSLLSSIGEGSRGTNDSDAHAASKVAESSGSSSGENSVSALLCLMENCLVGVNPEVGSLELIPSPVLWFSRQKNGNNNTINSNGLTENNPKIKLIKKKVLTYDTIFYAVILGVLIEEPTILDPEVKMPL